MSPLRIIIIAILLYIGYRLIFGGKKKVSNDKTESISSDTDTIEDVLVEDPVCHNLVPKQQAIHLNYKDEEMYFCSQECCNKFIEEKGESK